MFSFLAGPRRRRAGDRPPVPSGPLAIWMTCVEDGREHGVTDEEVARGSRHGGRYVAVCGHLVTPGSMTCAPGRRCRACHAALTPPARTRW
ncbi:hypothetical protein [Pseudonocardia acaciae]|uniref:hypothetical protein n=1 Tax=Pseudonocardia acaciae TaxID=551276 RepID=UPI00055ACB42|nr:hypothetical protein [Pseudonocardia acaciae]